MKKQRVTIWCMTVLAVVGMLFLAGPQAVFAALPADIPTPTAEPPTVTPTPDPPTQTPTPDPPTQTPTALPPTQTPTQTPVPTNTPAVSATPTPTGVPASPTSPAPDPTQQQPADRTPTPDLATPTPMPQVVLPETGGPAASQAVLGMGFIVAGSCLLIGVAAFGMRRRST